jgi:hypothetical protein
VLHHPRNASIQIVRLKNELIVIKADLKSRFRSGVGMILYLIKHSRPNVANVIRELDKFMDGVILAAYKEMLTVIKFVFDTKLFCLKMERKKDENDWNILVYINID